MWFLPYEKLAIKTQLNNKELIRKIADVTDTTGDYHFFSFLTSHKPYRGKIKIDGFEISRWINYRNSFLPTIKGEITPELSGTSIKIIMHPHFIVIIFIFLFVSGSIAPILRQIFNAILVLRSGTSFINEFSKVQFDLLVFPLFAYGLTMFGFKIESIKSKKYLKELFEAREVTEYNLFRFGDIGE